MTEKQWLTTIERTETLDEEYFRIIADDYQMVLAGIEQYTEPMECPPNWQKMTTNEKLIFVDNYGK